MIPLADSEGPDQTARMRRLISTFAVRICPKTRFRIARPIYEFIDIFWCLHENRFGYSLEAPQAFVNEHATALIIPGSLIIACCTQKTRPRFGVTGSNDEQNALFQAHITQRVNLRKTHSGLQIPIAVHINQTKPIGIGMCSSEMAIVHIESQKTVYISRNVRKRTFWNVRPTKTQISLRIRAVWSESSLSTWRNVASLAIQKREQWRFWSDYATAQADLNLRRAHMNQGTFSDVAVPLIIDNTVVILKSC